MLISSIRISLRRTRQNLRLTLAVVLGIVLAVALLATTVVYFEALRDIALARSLEPVEPARLDVMITAHQRPVGPAEDEVLIGRVEGEVIDRLDRHTSAEYLAFQSWTFLVDEPPPLVPIGECPCRPDGIASGPDDVPAINSDGELDPRATGSLIACDCKRISFITVPELEDSVTVVQGRLPVVADGPAPPGESMVIEGLLDAAAAEKFGLATGDSIPAAPFWESSRQNVLARVSGIYERADPQAPQWTIHDSEFNNATESLFFANFLVPETSFIQALGPYFPNMGADYVWLLDTDPATIHATDTVTIRSAIRVGQTSLSSEIDRLRIKTELEARLADFEVDLFFNRIPMLIVLALVAAVSLYYAAMVAGALLATQRSDVALMRSRGATRTRIFSMYVMEASVIALVALVVGPLLSMAVVSAIGQVPVFEDLNNGAALPVQLTRNVILVAALGAVFGMLALLIPAFRATGNTVLTVRHSRGRPGRLNIVQRYYLDLGLLGLVAALLWQLSRQGSFVATDVFGETSVNNLTLAVPALLLVMVGFALLRLLPVVADLGTRLFATRFGSIFVPDAAFIGVRRLARNPSGQARLSLLLVLASALGVFTATFASTLERSAREQVLYETGAEFRATRVSLRSGGRSASAEAELNDIEGLEAIAAVIRTTGDPDSNAISQQDRFTVLGVDTESFEDVAWYRRDFFGGSMGDLLNEISPDSVPGLPLFDDSWFISARIKTLVRRPGVLIVARMSDRNGRYYSLPIGDLSPTSSDPNRFNCSVPGEEGEPDWCRIGSSLSPAPIPRVQTLSPARPVTLHSIGIVSLDGPLYAGSILIDDIAVQNNLGEGFTIIEEFDDLSHFRTLQPTADGQGDGLTFERTESGAIVDGIAEFRWTDARVGEYRGLVFGQDEPTVPAIVSESFAEAQSAEVGDIVVANVEGARVRFRLVRTIESFPTLYGEQTPFLIADVSLLKERLNLERIANDVQPDEYWISTQLTEDGDPITAADIKEKLGGIEGGNFLSLTSGPVIDQEAALALVSLDPLVSTGWQALLAIAFAAVLFVSAAGYVVHARATFVERRSEMALLRTIGLSRLQVVVLVATEQLLVIGVAVVVGTFLGSRLGDTIFPFLAASGRVGSVAPPMVIQFEAAELGFVFGVMGLVVLTVMFAVIWFASRTAIHSIMRAGDG